MGLQESPEMRKTLIENMAIQQLIATEAVRRGLDKSPAFKAQAEMVRLSMLSNEFAKDYIKTNVLDPKDLQAEYEKFKIEHGGKEYKVKHILVPTEKDALSIERTLKVHPDQFESIAKAKSIDKGSAVNGGDLGWIDQKSVVPEFGDVIAVMEKGSMSEKPVKSQFGYHVIMIDDIRQREVETLEKVQPNLTQVLQMQSLKKFVADMRLAAKVIITPATATIEPKAVALPVALEGIKNVSSEKTLVVSEDTKTAAVEKIPTVAEAPVKVTPEVGGKKQ
jgi:peptidyl-prolyl cis-trans isomerase C